MNTKLNVVRFENEDVITTSSTPLTKELTFNWTYGGEYGYDIHTYVVGATEGDKISINGMDYVAIKDGDHMDLVYGNLIMDKDLGLDLMDGTYTYNEESGCFKK